jgi:hypothetical protein
MRYLVTIESVDDGQMNPPAEQAAFLESIVVPTLKMLKGWEDAGKVRGGILSGRRGAAFIADAASNEELSDIIRQLPVWGISEVAITPLDDLGHMLAQTEETARMLKSM